MSHENKMSKSTKQILGAVVAALAGSGYFAIPQVQGWAAAVTEVRVDLAQHELDTLKAERRILRREVREYPDDIETAVDLDEVEDEIKLWSDYIECLEEERTCESP